MPLLCRMGGPQTGAMPIRNLVNQILAFCVSQLIWMRKRLCRRSAVLAGKITGLRHLPDGQERRLIKVQPAARGNGVHRSHCLRKASLRNLSLAGSPVHIPEWLHIRGKVSQERIDPVPQSALEETTPGGSGCDQDHFILRIARTFRPAPDNPLPTGAQFPHQSVIRAQAASLDVYKRQPKTPTTLPTTRPTPSPPSVVRSAATPNISRLARAIRGKSRAAPMSLTTQLRR